MTHIITCGLRCVNPEIKGSSNRLYEHNHLQTRWFPSSFQRNIYPLLQNGIFYYYLTDQLQVMFLYAKGNKALNKPPTSGTWYISSDLFTLRQPFGKEFIFWKTGAYSFSFTLIYLHLLIICRLYLENLLTFMTSVDLY